MADASQFQPLFPEERVLGPLQDLATELIAECHRSAGQAVQPVARAFAPKLRAMNSYYTNKIEGQHIKPADIRATRAREPDRLWSTDRRDFARAGRLRRAAFFATVSVSEPLAGSGMKRAAMLPCRPPSQ